ncbi:T-complex protein 1 subunit theta-like [Impatiens glandulifera]|uniref:T-complex protein 1 subunit theta-like n=1 Tax=Impatiens glandulifera TaxID=253017 RepID=UPI001FB0B2C7|nr:T-complex protein 1 subunit theta-like [Impatiens glandulifera]
MIITNNPTSNKYFGSFSLIFVTVEAWSTKSRQSWVCGFCISRGNWWSQVRNEECGNSVSTVVLRGSTDDLERAVDDGVNTYKAMCRDSRVVPGAAATEIELARKLKEFSFKETGLDQYAIAKFVECFEMVPKTLSDNYFFMVCRAFKRKH